MSAIHTTRSLQAQGAASFDSANGVLDNTITSAVKGLGYELMTPVQQQVLKILNPLTQDCLVQAKTGTGKTIAFLLPALQNLLRKSAPKAQVSILILSPTRELGMQIAAEAERLVGGLSRPIEVHTAFGGTARASALARFKSGNPTILVATPGRLIDYMSENAFQSKIQNLQTLVLDEADRMLDQGFLPDILRILKSLPPKTNSSGGWQGMCFSATIPPKMQQVLSHVLSKNYASISTVDKSEAPTIDQVTQHSVVIPTAQQTFTALFSLISREIKSTGGPSKMIVFGTTANMVALHAKVFQQILDIKTFVMHSRMSQPARTKATSDFKATESGVIFASDVIGRGMDFPDVSHVIQVGLPADADAYTHRVGRTARAGKEGRALILLTKPEAFFLNKNPGFPITPYLDPIDDPNTSALNSVEDALHRIDPDIKRKAYTSYIGFMKTFQGPLGLNGEGLVRMSNDFALEGMKCTEVPEIDKRTVGKMGLKGVKGFNYAKDVHRAVPGQASKPSVQSGDQTKQPRKPVPGGIAGLTQSISSRQMNSEGTKVTEYEPSQGSGRRQKNDPDWTKPKKRRKPQFQGTGNQAAPPSR